MADEPTKPEEAPVPLETLLEKAFKSGPAMQANELIHDVRQRFLGEYARAANYEVSLLERSWEDARVGEGTRFRRFLRDMGFRSRPYGPVFVSLFSGDEIHFIGAQDFLEALDSGWGEGALLPVLVERE